jgi:hypothetical protein
MTPPDESLVSERLTNGTDVAGARVFDGWVNLLVGSATRRYIRQSLAF